MKKTLIALAALAATGASFAQVTISGNVGLSWQQSPVIQLNTNASTPSDGSHIQGLSVNDGEIYLSAKEDLGGGMSASARGGFTMRGRGTAILDRDATVSLTGDFGAITAGAVRSCGTLVAVQSGVVTGTVYTSNETNRYTPLDTCSIVDMVAYTIPMGPVMLTATYGEFAAGASYKQDGPQWLDSKGNANGVTFGDIAGVYNAGPLMVGLNVTSFSVITDKAVGAGSAFLVPADGVIRTRLVGTYDMGVAKFGLGYQNKTGGSADQYVASVAVPMGNAVFGLDYTARDAQGKFDKGTAGAVAAYVLGNTRDGDKASSSVGLGMTYSFSKTTTLNASYITYTDAGANTKYAIPTSANIAAGTTVALYNTAITQAGKTNALYDTEYRIRLMKAF